MEFNSNTEELIKLNIDTGYWDMVSEIVIVKKWVKDKDIEEQIKKTFDTEGWKDEDIIDDLIDNCIIIDIFNIDREIEM